MLAAGPSMPAVRVPPPLLASLALAVAVALPSMLSAGEVRSWGLPPPPPAPALAAAVVAVESGGEMALSVEMPLSLLHIPAGREVCVGERR